MRIPAAPATLPNDPERLPGWDAQWSRLVPIHAPDGARTLHVLDTGPLLDRMGAEPVGTILAVHGNPTWSYFWRSLATTTLESAGDGGAAWRVVAPDQLDMGFSERLEHDGAPSAQLPGDYRTLGQRIDDLDALVDALGLDRQARDGHRLVTLGHDWGGVISLGWAGRHRDLVAGAISLNTAVHQDPDDPVPAPLRAALTGPLLPGSTVLTDAFLRVATSLGHPRLGADVVSAYHAPYRGAARRGGIGGFVADIPVTPDHRSAGELNRVAGDLSAVEAPALLLWGPRDPVFVDRYLADLLDRLPHADLHRFETAGHLVAEDRDIAAPVLQWLDAAVLTAARQATGDRSCETAATTATAATSIQAAPPEAGGSAADLPYRPVWSFLDEWQDRHGSQETALVDMTAGTDGPEPISWGRLSAVVEAIAVGLTEQGVRPGDRVSLMVTPGRDLTAALYACLRIGAIVVVADAGLGIGGMTRAVRSARPRWVIGKLPGLLVASAQSWPGRRLSVSTLARPLAAGLQVEDSLYGMAERHRDRRLSEVRGPQTPDPGPEDPAAILFTSGSTGPAKGVLYTHGRLSALTQLLRETFDVTPGSSLLAGFAPFALLGPAIGATSVTPEMSVTRPATLTAAAVARAAEAGDATILFASPAALRNVVATTGELTEDQRAVLGRIRLVLSAGAPVHPRLMARVAGIFPAAEIHSPYGMTESLLLADIDRQTIEELSAEAADSGGAAPGEDGVCVGTPVGPVRIAIAPLNPDGAASSALVEGAEAAGTLGEVVVSAPHMKAGYDRLWLTDATSRRDARDGLEWHRTQDVGHLDDAGRLWIEGRLQHVVTTPEGPVAPGGPEARVDALEPVRRSAIVGVGPAGTQAVVAVVEASEEPAADRSTPRARGSGRRRAPRPGLAPADLTAEVRVAAAPVPVAAVLVTTSVPVDIRHNSKIDRSRLARWAERVLAGGTVGTP